MKKIAIFASGNGSNAENIIRYFQSRNLNAEVVLVVSNRTDARVLQRAASFGVHSRVITREMLRDQKAVMSLMRQYEIDFIVETADTPEDVARKIHELEQLHFPRVIADALLSC